MIKKFICRGKKHFHLNSTIYRSMRSSWEFLLFLLKSHHWRYRKVTAILIVGSRFHLVQLLYQPMQELHHCYEDRQKSKGKSNREWSIFLCLDLLPLELCNLLNTILLMHLHAWWMLSCCKGLQQLHQGVTGFGSAHHLPGLLINCTKGSYLEQNSEMAPSQQPQGAGKLGTFNSKQYVISL